MGRKGTIGMSDKKKETETLLFHPVKTNLGEGFTCPVCGHVAGALELDQLARAFSDVEYIVVVRKKKIVMIRKSE
jgi:transcription elongation factor Elf1